MIVVAKDLTKKGDQHVIKTEYKKASIRDIILSHRHRKQKEKPLKETDKNMRSIDKPWTTQANKLT